MRVVEFEKVESHWTRHELDAPFLRLPVYYEQREARIFFPVTASIRKASNPNFSSCLNY